MFRPLLCLRFCVTGVVALILAGTSIGAADLAEEIRLLKEQNQKLQQQLNEQRALIDELRQKVETVPKPEDASPKPEAEGLLKNPLGNGNLIISGEAGVAFFSQGAKGAFPKSEFRIDEAKLFFDAKLWENAYFFTELNLVEREQPEEYFYLGELYVDFEEIARRWNPRLLNVRVGRFDTPFGEEYLHRDAIDNALVSHSLGDIWGVDEGIEVYGSIERFRYVLAVQNGGSNARHDFDSDKGIIARFSYQPLNWLYLSGSAMRTGRLNTAKDTFSAVWFGNGFFRQAGPAAATPGFSAELLEGDVRATFSRGYVVAAGGYAHTSDLEPARNQRDIYYYYVESAYDLTRKFYAAGRFSQIFAHRGYPLVGAGDFGAELYGAPFTEELWRLSLGLGYRWTKDLVTKVEYSFNNGRRVTGAARDHENFVGVELSLRF